MMKATEKEAVAVTAVFWDIKRCPVPPGYDARRVGPCIKRLLKNLGYSGPLTITAVGILTEVPDDVLRAITSTGIALDHVPYDYKSIVTVIYRWSWENPPPANVMIISTCFNSLDGELSRKGYNTLYLPDGPHESRWASSTKPEHIWNNFLLADTGALEEDKCSETSESVHWVCSVCRDVDGHGFENFTTHLSSEKHALKLFDWFPVQSGCDEEDEETVDFSFYKDVAVTAVFWDIRRCPVPPGFDARRVGPCIEQFLKKLGYSGPLTITAVGVLTDVPHDVLHALVSTEINLKPVPNNKSIESVIYHWAEKNPPPANVMVISTCFSITCLVGMLFSDGYNTLPLFPYGSNPVRIWKKFLLADTGALEEDKCSETACTHGFSTG